MPLQMWLLKLKSPALKIIILCRISFSNHYRQFQNPVFEVSNHLKGAVKALRREEKKEQF